jgi:hypothetical protein
MFPLSGPLKSYQELQIQIQLGSGHLCGIPRDILNKGLPISDNPLYSSFSLSYEMISRVRASLGIILSIGAVLFAIWPNILPLQQHFAMAQLVPGSAPAPPPPYPVVGNNTVELGNATPGALGNATPGAQPSCPPHCNQ